MANINKNIIFSSLTQHVNNEWAEKALKKNPEYAKAISAITTADLIIGDPPTIRRGYVEGNSTAVGKSSNGDTVTTRTISISFSTDEYYFTEKYDAALAEFALGRLGTYCKCHTPAEAEHLATKYGKTECRNSLYDLNFSMDEYRLNRYRLIYTEDPLTLPAYPIYANISVGNGKSQSVFLGYCYIKDGATYTHWNIPIPMTAKKKWIIGGIIAAAVLIGAIILFSL